MITRDGGWRQRKVKVEGDEDGAAVARGFIAGQ